MPGPSPVELLASVNQLVLALQRTYLPRASVCTTPPGSRRRQRLDHLSRLLIRLQRLTTRERQDASDWISLNTLLQHVDQDFLDGLSGGIGSSSGKEAHDDGDDQSGSLPKRLEGTTLAMRNKLRQVIQGIQAYLQSTSVSTRKRRRPRDGFISDHELEHPATGTTPDPLTLREKLDQAYALHLAVHDPLKLEQHRRIGPLPPAPADAEGSQEEGATVPSLSTASQILSRLPPHWTETTLSSLRSSEPEVTLDGLKALLWKHADSLIPSRLGHGNLKPLLRDTLLAPTSRPLSYATFKTKILHPLFELLGRLCSPARDDQARTLMERLDKSKQVEHVVALTLDALVLIDQMHLDLRFARKLAKRHLGSEQLDRLEMEKKAIESERRVVWQILKNKEWGTTVLPETGRWIRERGGAEAGSTMEKGFRKALLEAVFDTRAVECVDINSTTSTSTTTEGGSSHRLPLTLLVPASRIFTLQNHLQALVIVACLNSVVSSNVALGSTSQERSNMTRRLWTLLQGIVASDSESNGKGEGEIKLVNLVDEVMQLHRGKPAWEKVTKEENMEEGLKRRVESVLRYEDPVFKLFSRRLKEGVERELDRTSSTKLGEDRNVPRELKTGRQLLSSSSTPSTPSTPKPEAGVVSIKGFEDLQEPLGQVLVQLQAILDWAQKVWGEELGWTRSEVSQI
ncbi:hypothetical protein MVLG_03999 [Microbotryum lychnidis-dioicae p1A1 Lamole]|uniref:Uncharacterized protein n=1 Tax=Microbotryum lychnidis-dioicae (strain p1A1 Lamole / MvSl-1064) TaxID=683840 RepID=U5H9W2_USTV1|nr:hypothetical protein MVLG_03999 [Microbotryum lychnidis-dioicae p1A1 Lamole]|eukprot:KDE05628.1 hypothetical protein MVLG_03999 [Microbotryum lychnidis-dioicae p1A1 Lamole]